MIAYCGINCETCEARIATIKNDDKMRVEVAKKWCEMNHTDQITPDSINCTGCRVEGEKFYFFLLPDAFEQIFRLEFIGKTEEAVFAETAEMITPEELAEIAERMRPRGNIGLAFTYNEPLVGYEFVRDTARLTKEKGLKNVLVTNGTAELAIWEELKPCIDAMNIDLKGFTDRYYSKVLGGDRQQTMAFIEEAVKSCHVELTTLIVPGENDSEEEMRELSKWVSGLKNPDGEGVPLHISRFFPRFHMQDRKATPVRTVYRLAEIAREKVEFVYTGNC